MLRRYFSIAVAAAALGAAVPALAALPYDTPAVTADAIGHGKIRMTITAGASGAPDGFGVYWMTYADYENYGSYWPSDLGYPGLNWSMFTGTPTLNQFVSGQDDALAPFESITVEIGDLSDETGLTSNSTGELESGTYYVLCSFARGGVGGAQSAYSQNIVGTPSLQGSNCTYTLGYWKNHPSAWPVTSLTLGTVTYTQSELLQILGTAAAGNGLISLAHQLIAAKLNIAQGAATTTDIDDCVSTADGLIGGLVVPPIGSGFLSPGATAATTQCLDDFNNGITGPGHCGTTPAQRSTWGRVKTLYR